MLLAIFLISASLFLSSFIPSTILPSSERGCFLLVSLNLFIKTSSEASKNYFVIVVVFQKLKARIDVLKNWPPLKSIPRATLSTFLSDKKVSKFWKKSRWKIVYTKPISSIAFNACVFPAPESPVIMTNLINITSLRLLYLLLLVPPLLLFLFPF